MYRETFGQKLKAARENAGYTQKQISEITKICRTQISRFENGKQEPSIEQLGIMADFLAVSTDWLIGTQGQNKPETSRM